MKVNLEKLNNKAERAWNTLQESNKPLVLVGTATCGRSAGSLDALGVFKKARKLHSVKCNIIEVGCIGTCYIEPVVCIKKPGKPTICYGNVTAKRAEELSKAYLSGDDPMRKYALGTIGEGSIDGMPKLFDTPVFKYQARRTLRNCGFIDPTDIMHYIANDGYSGLQKAILIGPKKVVEEIKKSGLRGRGGAGFPTWRKR